jgi:cyclic pyranopterin phosphate synthase
VALDRFGRNIHYLRISLTDHCNLRCVYCMPEDQTFRPNADLLQDDEILLLARLFADLGFDKIRLTGGEPTVRANVVEIVRGIASTPGIRSVSMTTNGVLLGKLATPLKEAGLERVNVSIDTLDPEKFHRLTRWGKLEQVWEGILAAEAAGLSPVKLNAVWCGYNDEPDWSAGRTAVHPWRVRHRMMPFSDPSSARAGGHGRRNDRAIEARLKPSRSRRPLTARRAPPSGRAGHAGFISSVRAVLRGLSA